MKTSTQISKGVTRTIKGMEMELHTWPMITPNGGYGAGYYYSDHGLQYAGYGATEKEAIEKLNEHVDDAIKFSEHLNFKRKT